MEQLGEQEHMGGITSSVITFATHRLAEIHRARATKNENNSWQLDNAVWKNNDNDLTDTFRPLFNDDVCITA